MVGRDPCPENVKLWTNLESQVFVGVSCVIFFKKVLTQKWESAKAAVTLNKNSQPFLGGGMIDLDVTFFVQLANFLVILTVLNLILYRPIRGIIKKRAEVMSEKLRLIEGFAADAEEKLANYKTALSGSRTQAQAVRMGKREEGQAAEADLLAKAAKDAAEKLAAARKEIESQKASAMKVLRADVSGYSKKVAEKVLSKA